MKTFATLAGSISLWLLGASVATAGNYYCSPVFHVPLGRAPDMCHRGYYIHPCNGYPFGPNYYVYPPFPPFQPNLPSLYGPMPLPGYQQLHAHQMRQQGSPAFPSHPYARSPRDFFMFHDVVRDRLNQTGLPKIAP